MLPVNVNVSVSWKMRCFVFRVCWSDLFNFSFRSKASSFFPFSHFFLFQTFIFAKHRFLYFEIWFFTRLFVFFCVNFTQICFKLILRHRRRFVIFSCFFLHCLIYLSSFGLSVPKYKLLPFILFCLRVKKWKNTHTQVKAKWKRFSQNGWEPLNYIGTHSIFQWYSTNGQSKCFQKIIPVISSKMKKNNKRKYPWRLTTDDRSRFFRSFYFCLFLIQFS